MITTSTLAHPLVVLAAALVAIPLAAEEPVIDSAGHQPVYHERVGFADLDLRQLSAQQTLYRRVRQASDRICELSEGRFNAEFQYGQNHSCAYQTAQQAQPQIAASIRRAEAGQLRASALVITGPANARR